MQFYYADITTIHTCIVTCIEMLIIDVGIFRSTGQKPYIMPVGSSNTTGMWGYIEAFRELLDQV